VVVLRQRMATASAEIEGLLGKLLSFLQSDRRLRVALGVVMVGALLCWAGKSVYELLPRHHTLTITGGDIVGNRHYLARVLQAEAPKKDLTLILQPEPSAVMALKKVSEGKLDLALIQGGETAIFPNVEHVATIAPEQVHLLVRTGINGIGDLRGHSLNLGAEDSPEHAVGLTITRFAHYEENVDFVETNFSPEQLLALPDHSLPDAIFIISSVPSYLVELLVRENHYSVMEIPFPESLALRYGWAADARILSYAYNLDPPVPTTNIQTVAVNEHLVANSRVDPGAISKLLEVLYSPSVASQLRHPIDAAKIGVPSGYPISRGMTAYLTRNDSIITIQAWHQLTGFFGLIMSFGGMFIVMVKWFRGTRPVYHDEEFHGYLLNIANISRAAFAMEAQGTLNLDELKRLRDQLGELRASLMERYTKVTFKDPMLFDRCIASARASHEHVARVIAQAEGAA